MRSNKMKIENNEFARYITENKVDTRWAYKSEIENAETITKINKEDDDYKAGGIPILVDGNSIYVDDSDTHTIIFGSTGSKKTRLFAMPLLNILAKAGESFIVTDPKGELFKKTSGLAANKGYDIQVFDFRELKHSDNWNPLSMPYDLYHSGKTEEAIDLINDLKTILAESQKKDTKDAYFINLSCQHFLAMMLFFIDTATKEEANFYNFTHFLNSRTSLDGVLEIAGGESSDTHKIYRKIIANGSIADINFRASIQPAARTFGNITTGVSAMLEHFTIRKELGKMMSKSSFDMNKIGHVKTAIYLIIPDEKSTLHFLVTLFIKQVYETMVHVAHSSEDGKLPVRLNFVLDEFANIPAIPDMSNMISAARSRNMRFFLLLQGMKQLEHKYDKEADTIKGNCENLIFLASKEWNLIEEISKLCGVKLNEMNVFVPLISTSQLQMLKKEREYSEALIRHGRNHPYVSYLPDIDTYKFTKFDPIKLSNKTLPEIERYDAEKVIEEIKTGKRPVPFSKEEFGEDIYLNSETEKKEKIKENELFDW